MKTSILRRVCPSGLNRVCVGWWGESNLNGVQSSRGGTRHTTHDTHIHTHGKSYHHTPIVAYGFFQRTPSLQRGWKYRKWVEPPLRWRGHCLSLQFSVPFSQGSVIERWKLEKLPQVETKSQNSFIFLVIYEQGRSQLGTDERARGWFYVFLCLHKKQNKCVCACMICMCAGWQSFSGSNFPCHI